MINTERLKLRLWRDGDRLPFRMMCADAKVMEHLNGPLSAAAADAVIDRMSAAQQRQGHCFWAVERKADSAFLGFCGLLICDVAGTPVEGEIEIGWRLRRDVWGMGFAKEAAIACFEWGFRNVDCEHIVALTSSANTRSWGLMDTLGMKRRPELDFIEPWTPPVDVIVYAKDRPDSG